MEVAGLGAGVGAADGAGVDGAPLGATVAGSVTAEVAGLVAGPVVTGPEVGVEDEEPLSQPATSRTRPTTAADAMARGRSAIPPFTIPERLQTGAEVPLKGRPWATCAEGPGAVAGGWRPSRSAWSRAARPDPER